MKKQPTVVELSLLLSLALVVVIVYGVREFYIARAQRDACHRANLEKLNSLEPSWRLSTPRSRRFNKAKT